MATCPRCGTVIESGSVFCEQCGIKLASQPRRKGLALASLVLGVLAIPTLGLLVVGGVAAIVLGIVAWSKANRQPEVYEGRGLAIAGAVCGVLSLLVIPLVGLVGALAIPGLVRARNAANEAATKGDLRAIVSAELVYATVNGGYYDRLECLPDPGACVPGYTGEVFLASEVIAQQKNGYIRSFHPGAPAQAGPSVSPSSVQAFAVVAVPESPGPGGGQSFCADSSGRVCSIPEGTSPQVVDGVCPTSCLDLER